jgi:hypothetical protein
MLKGGLELNYMYLQTGTLLWFESKEGVPIITYYHSCGRMSELSTYMYHPQFSRPGRIT